MGNIDNSVCFFGLCESLTSFFFFFFGYLKKKTQKCTCARRNPPRTLELRSPAALAAQLRQQPNPPTLRLLSFSGTSRGPSPVTLASQDALPIAVAFTESVNAYFKGADPTKWVSHDCLCRSKVPTPIGTHAHICPYLNLTHAIAARRRFAPRAVDRRPHPFLGAVQVECFVFAWHHSFRVDNLGEVDYSLRQRKHTGFYWPTAA